MTRTRPVRISDGDGVVGTGLITWGAVRDDSDELYDPAYGPRWTTRPVYWMRMRRPVDEWDDPVLDAVILKVDALAQVEAATRRAAVHNWSKAERNQTKQRRLVGYEHWLSADQVAERAGVTISAVYHWVQRGTGPRSVTLGYLRRWDPVSVDAWVARRRRRGTDHRKSVPQRT